MRLIIEEVENCGKCLHLNYDDYYGNSECSRMDSDGFIKWESWLENHSLKEIYPDCPLPKILEGPDETITN